ncbi:MAG: FAD-dependent oxidoreductase [Verrucomicrobiota bacterium]
MSAPYQGVAKRPKAARRKALPKGSRLVVIGNGMVSCKLCQLLVDAGLNKRLEITIIGRETLPAYDRINLSKFVDSKNADQLILKNQSWYEEHGIQLLLGTEVSSVEQSLKTVRLSNGQSLNYDLLVFATGSRPFVPPIEGSDLPNVFLYRTVQDLETIVAAAHGKQQATVIGGGLLGIEAAQAIQKLGLDAAIVERAAFLMPRQLNQKAANLLQSSVAEQNIALHLGKSSTTITQTGDRLKVSFNSQESFETDLVIISAGITPNSELAAAAGLSVGVRGGIVVDHQLETEDPNILAIGECALLNGRIYGLAAPGYAMARHLVDRIAGKRMEPFPEPDLSTRLKMLGVDVVTIGDSLEEGRQIEFESDGIYRMLIMNGRGELKGGLGVGPWPEAGKVQSLFLDGHRIREKEQDHFLKEGVLAPGGGTTPVNQWPDERVVCNCMAINKGQLVSCLAKCHNDPDQIASATGASTVCGSCRPLLEELCGSTTSPKKAIGTRSLLTASSLALLGVLVTIFAPPMAMAESVESWWYQVDKFWRDNVIKQITGYSLMAIFLIGLLISLRKRFKWFRIGHFAHWRVFHAVFGIVALIALFIHTGFRFGHNLNFWLMFTFVGLNLLGAFAGIVSALESTGTSSTALVARRFRPVLTYAHLVLFWPLPVLLVFHILSVYLY